MWIDDYYRKQYGPKKPYKFGNRKIESKELREVIDDVTGKVYGTVDAAKKYDTGVKFVSLYDSLVRKNYLGIVPLVERFKLGPVMYRSNLSRVIPYLNLDHQELRNPETGEIFTESFDDLYQRAIDMSLETIKDVDDYLYLDKPLKNYYIENDISYNSGLSCSLGQTCPYAKEYTDEELYNLAIRVLESNSLNSASKDAIKAGVMIAPLLLSLPLMCKDGELSADLNSLLVSLSGVLLVGTEELVCIIKDMANVSDSSVRKRK